MSSEGGERSSWLQVKGEDDFLQIRKALQGFVLLVHLEEADLNGLANAMQMCTPSCLVFIDLKRRVVVGRVNSMFRLGRHPQEGSAASQQRSAGSSSKAARRSARKAAAGAPDFPMFTKKRRVRRMIKGRFRNAFAV